MLLYTFINQYEDLSNFYYLACFKPIDTAFGHLFHKSEKRVDEIAGYYFKPIDIDIYLSKTKKYQMKLPVIVAFSQNF